MRPSDVEMERESMGASDDAAAGRRREASIGLVHGVEPMMERVMTLTVGDYFGEHQRRSPSAFVASGTVDTISMPIDLFEHFVTDEQALIGVRLDELADAGYEEVKSLIRHIDQYCELLALRPEDAPPSPTKSIRAALKRSASSESATSNEAKADLELSDDDDQTLFGGHEGGGGIDSRVSQLKLMGDLLTAFSPELSLDDVMERMVIVTQNFFHCGRVALYTIVESETESEPTDGPDGSGTGEPVVEVIRQFEMKVAREAVDASKESGEDGGAVIDRGMLLPVAGLVGLTVEADEPISVPDAPADLRFNSETDVASEFKAVQMLCVPVSESSASGPCAVLQIVNSHNGEPFSVKDEMMLYIVAEQLGQVLRKSRRRDETLNANAFQSIGGSEKSMRMSSSMNLATTNNVRELPYTPIFLARGHFRVHIGGLTFARPHNHILLTAQLYHGGVPIGSLMETPMVTTQVARDGGREVYVRSLTDGTGWADEDKKSAANNTVRCGVRHANFDIWLEEPSVQLSALPQATRIIFQLSSKNKHGAGWTGCSLFGFNHQLIVGKRSLRMWPGECPTPNATTLEARDGDSQQTTMSVAFQRLSEEPDEKPIIYQRLDLPARKKQETPSRKPTSHRRASARFSSQAAPRGQRAMTAGYGYGYSGESAPSPVASAGPKRSSIRASFVKEMKTNELEDVLAAITSITAEAKARLVEILHDPLGELTDADKELCWRFRYFLSSVPEALPAVLLSANWSMPIHIAEVSQVTTFYDTFVPFAVVTISLPAASTRMDACSNGSYTTAPLTPVCRPQGVIIVRC